MPAPVAYPTHFAFGRDWGVPGVELAAFPALAENWAQSRERVNEIREHLQKVALPRGVRTLAVAGSLGRMEYAEESDCDLLVVLTEDVRQDRPAAEAAYAQVWEAIKPVAPIPPKPTGTFATPTSEEHLCDKRHVGAAGEDLRELAKRQLLLLETQPVYNDAEYEKLVTGVVGSYAEGYVDKKPAKEWVFLLNDLIRYFRSLCVNYQWDFRTEHVKWPLRNTKLRHSRLAMYSGLLLLLGQGSLEKADKVTWLRERLKMTPLERIAWTYQSNGDPKVADLLRLYDTFLAGISDPVVRAALNKADPDSYEKRYENEHYKRLKDNSDGFVRELLRFTLGRRDVWTDRFFEYLVY
jgi:predicted nucleotidyltransferase